MKYQLVIFDFDGTLANSFPWMLTVMNEIADRHGFVRPSEEDLHILRGPKAGTLIERLKVPRWKLPLIARDGRKLMAQSLEKIALFEGVPHLFQELRSHGVQIAMVSSNSEANVRKIMGPVVASHVTLFECGASFLGKRRKFRKVLKRTGISKDQVLSVGDELRDAEAAQAEGLSFGAVSWGIATPGAFDHLAPQHVFTEMADILSIFAFDEQTVLNPGQ